MSGPSSTCCDSICASSGDEGGSEGGGGGAGLSDVVLLLKKENHVTDAGAATAIAAYQDIDDEWLAKLPSRVVHVVYDKFVAGTDQVGEICAVLRSLGLVAHEYFVDAAQALELPNQIAKSDLVFLHLDTETKLQPGEKHATLRFLEESFPYVWGFSHNFAENCLWKSVMNEIFEREGIPHCPTLRIDNSHLLDEKTVEETRRIISQKINGPYFVKLDNGMNSEALCDDCVALTVDAAIDAAQKMMLTVAKSDNEAGRELSAAHAVAIQEYASGREFTVAVFGGTWNPATHFNCKEEAESIAMHPIERLFSDGEKYSPPNGTRSERVVDAVTEENLVRELRDVARRAFAAINHAGAACYGRVDVRQDSRGRACVLEVNDTCGFGRESYFALSCHAAGWTRARVLRSILERRASQWCELDAKR